MPDFTNLYAPLWELAPTPEHPLLTALNRIAGALEKIAQQGEPDIYTINTVNPVSYAIADVKLTEELYRVMTGRPSFVPELVFVEATDSSFDYSEIDWDTYDDSPELWGTGLLPLTAEAAEELGEFVPVPEDLLADGVFVAVEDCWARNSLGSGYLDKWVGPVDPGYLIYGELLDDGTKKTGAIWGGMGAPNVGFYRIDERGLRELGLVE